MSAGGIAQPSVRLNARLTGIFIYPVKSLRGCPIPAGEVDPCGLVGDRRFLLVDAHDRPLTQRTRPDLARIAPVVTPDRLELHAEGRPVLEVRRHSDPDAPLRRFDLWGSTGLVAEDCGAEAADWFGRILGPGCRLLRLGRDYRRSVLKSAARPDDRVGLADAGPFLLTSDSSLAELNDRLADRGEPPVPMSRFRPNLVIAGAPAGAEDSWKRIRIGPFVFRSAGPSTRCVICCTDQRTGERHREPLRTLATFRRAAPGSADVIFGTNLIHEVRGGRLEVGAPVEILG